MKGNEQVLAMLNRLLSEELTAINQYMVHSEMCDNWGYPRLHKVHEKRAIDEMRHAERLIARILFLEGVPVVTRYGAIHIGESAEKQLRNDCQAEVEAIQEYNEAIRLAGDQGDHGTREILEDILKDEEAHLDWLEAQLDQISQMGLAPWLAEQVRD
ncbi:bacterioferritin [Myxococcota bacterium]|jgi:bacterioferritin|nr:bacterioferritin [Myxococcota bacterium]